MFGVYPVYTNCDNNIVHVTDVGAYNLISCGAAARVFTYLDRGFTQRGKRSTKTNSKTINKK